MYITRLKNLFISSLFVGDHAFNLERLVIVWDCNTSGAKRLVSSTIRSTTSSITKSRNTSIGQILFSTAVLVVLIHNSSLPLKENEPDAADGNVQVLFMHEELVVVSELSSFKVSKSSEASLETDSEDNSSGAKLETQDVSLRLSLSVLSSSSQLSGIGAIFLP